MLEKCSEKRINDFLYKLKTFDGAPDQPGTTRMLFTNVEMAARDYVKEQMEDAGLVVTEDAIGNIYGTLAGEEPELAPVWSGSHIDTVIQAGMYDGMAGVVSAIEACRCIRDSGERHRRSITVLVYSSEEPTRFGRGCIGSTAMAGMLSLEETKHITDDHGITLYSELERLGYTKKDYEKTVVKHKGDVFANIELHIEQAPVLERIGIPVGLVTGICAPSLIHVTFTGRQDHAGATPMCDRRDVMPAAAQVILELESLARAYGNTHSVATVGKLNLVPNASNVIPGKVTFDIDIRDIYKDTKQQVMDRICRYIDTVAEMRGLTATHEVATNDTPCVCSEPVLKVLEESCGEVGTPYNRMTSGAYHDSLLVASFAPVAMIFVPSKGGISHDPAEFTKMEDITLGANVLTRALLKLSNMDVLPE